MRDSVALREPATFTPVLAKHSTFSLVNSSSVGENVDRRYRPSILGDAQLVTDLEQRGCGGQGRNRTADASLFRAVWCYHFNNKG
jgi:hypothetical protein